MKVCDSMNCFANTPKPKDKKIYLFVFANALFEHYECKQNVYSSAITALNPRKIRADFPCCIFKTLRLKAE